jgi:hypothetical protein
MIVLLETGNIAMRMPDTSRPARAAPESLARRRDS